MGGGGLESSSSAHGGDGAGESDRAVLIEARLSCERDGVGSIARSWQCWYDACERAALADRGVLEGVSEGAGVTAESINGVTVCLEAGAARCSRAAFFKVAQSIVDDVPPSQAMLPVRC